MKRDLEAADLPPAGGRTGGIGSSPSAAADGSRPAIGRRAIRITVIGVLLLASGLSLWAWSSQQSHNVISRTAVVRGEITEVGTRFSGMLMTSDAPPGQRVRAGQVLGRLDDRHLRAQENEAIAQLDELQRQLALERSTIEQDRASRAVRVQESGAKVMAAQAEVRAARLRVAEAEEYRRVRKSLAADGMISMDAMREVESRAQLAAEGLEVSASNAKAAQSALRSAELDVAAMVLREQHLGVLSAQIDAARARLARVRADMESTIIRAPSDGTVVRWLIKAGGSVDIGKPVLSFSMGADRWVEAWIDEDEVKKIRPGAKATVTLPFEPGRAIEGVVERIGVTTDIEQPPTAPPEPRATRMRNAPIVGVDVRLQGAPDTLLPGLSATVAIQTDGR